MLERPEKRMADRPTFWLLDLGLGLDVEGSLNQRISRAVFFHDSCARAVAGERVSRFY